MATMKKAPKAQLGRLIKKGVEEVAEKAAPKSFKLDKDIVKNVITKNEREALKEKMRQWDKRIDKKKTGGTMKKAKTGTSLGMKSVKAGYDKNPGVTRADFVSIGKGKAKSGTKMKMGGKMKKAQNGYVDPGELIKDAGPMLKTKVKERSDDGNYVKKTVTRTRKGATTTASKTRRSLQGYLKGAPKVSELKNGGKMAKCKYGCK